MPQQLRALQVLGLLLLMFAAPLTSSAALQPKKIKMKLNLASVVAPNNSIQILYDDVTPEDQTAIASAVKPNTSWSILVDDKLSTVNVQSVSNTLGLTILNLSQALDVATLSKHQITILFAGDPASGVQPESVDLKQPKPTISSWHAPALGFSADKKNANFDVSGSLQTGVGATPQYTWSVLAKYPVEYTGSSFVFLAGPQFTGTASQKTNADPDSMAAGLPIEVDFPDVKKLVTAANFVVNPVNYEFERKPKQEAVLVNGKATLNSYQQKNTNLITSVQMQLWKEWPRYKKTFNPPNVGINLGTEFGTAISRSVLNLNNHAGYSDNPLRTVAGADMNFNLPKLGKSPFLSVDGHYTVRSPFHPEPFQQAKVNGGNEFYSTKARHYIAVNFARALAKGANLTVQYRFGSLPPTFCFIDHQITIGLEIILGK